MTTVPKERELKQNFIKLAKDEISNPSKYIVHLKKEKSIFYLSYR